MKSSPPSPSVDTLENIDYNSALVHSTSGTLLQNMVLYHMNADDRTTFLQITAPPLPAELGDNLATPLKTWIRGTYAPAFISFLIAQTKAKDVTWRNAFSQVEIDKVWYWWNGMGSSCLSKTSEYNQINALTSVAAMRQLYNTDLQPFLQSPEPQGPTYWAQSMYDKLNTTHAKSTVLRKPINGGESILNKYCNIMLALDPTGKATDQYFDAVVAYAVVQNISNPYFPLDNDGATALAQQEWLNDSMKQLIISVKPKDLPKTPVETFIDNTARPLIAGLTAPPPLSLTYTVPANLPAGSTAGFSITAKNNTAAAVTLTRSTLTLEVGNDDNALFSGPTTSWTVDSAFNTTKPLNIAGTVGASPPTISAAQITENDVNTGLNSYDVAVVGPAINGTSAPLVVEVGASVSISWLGTISQAGSTTMQIVETLVNGDKCRLLLVINRV